MTLHQEVRSALRELDLRAKKSRGQNFLIHEHVVEAILRLLHLESEDEVLEIGPGLGFLTRRVVADAKKVWAVEVDGRLIEYLQRRDWSARANFQLIAGDILQVPIVDWLPDRKIKVLGNLPYNISTEVLFRLFDLRGHFSCLVIMLQKEVADRLASGPGTKDYGVLSVWCQLHGVVTDKVSVSPEAFFPKPTVRSTVLRIDLREQSLVDEKEFPAMKNLLRAAFGQRRKTLSNGLVTWLQRERGAIDNLLAEHKIDPKRRGESLAVNEFVALMSGLRARGWLVPAQRGLANA
ncbi:MAG: ribosomal RNA small subunit methyltransferase A [Deltaproteobacteria bacterium]|nr:ribosomal RNA small subunit methyltransferase A [Deltaproteobacteria bacterium]